MKQVLIWLCFFGFGVALALLPFFVLSGLST